MNAAHERYDNDTDDKPVMTRVWPSVFLFSGHSTIMDAYGIIVRMVKEGSIVHHEINQTETELYLDRLAVIHVFGRH